MAYKYNGAEGGVDGTVGTTSNTGGTSGDAFWQVTTGTTFSASAKIHGNFGYTASAAAANFTAWDTTGASKIMIRSYFRLNSPAVGHTMARVSMSTSGVALNTLSSGNVQLFFSGSGRATSTNPLVANTVYRQQVLVDPTASVLRVAIWNADDSLFFDSGAVTVALGTIGATYFGHYGAIADRADWDSVAVRTDSDAVWESWPVTNVAPVVAKPSNQNVSAGAAVSLSFAATDSDGSIVLRSTTFDYPASGAPALTGAATTTPSFTAGAAGSLYVLRHTATDDQGATGFTTVEVRVPQPGDFSALPTTATGGWTRTGGAASDGVTISDSLDTTWMESAALTASVQTFRIRVAPSVSRTTVSSAVRLAKTDSGSVTCKVRLVEGSTVRQEWTDITLTTTPTTFTRTVTDPTAISDWGNLYLEVLVST